jgi:gliding motility-associated-like protein
LVSGGVGPYTALWSNGATGLTANNLAPDNYQVTVTDANNCTQNASFTITLNNGPNVSLVSSQELSCFGAADGSAEIAVVGGDAPYTYVWTPNVSTSNLAENLTAGTYSVAVTDANNCTTQFEFAINQPNEIQVQPDVSNPTCGLQNGSISLNVSGGTAPYTYSWSPVAGNAMTISNLSAGTYTAEISDANGCSASFSQTIQTEGVIPFSVSASSIVIQPGDTANLGVFVDPAITDFDVYWSPEASVVCPTCPFTQAGPLENTTYIVTVSTPDGCVTTSSILVLVQIPCNGVFLPTIFSPNQDGLNDSYCILGSCLESIEFAIYNRWGEEVFRTNDQSRCWDGKFRGKDAPQGVYAYKFIATESNGKTVIESGNISLVR